MREVVIVTGGSSGIGKATATYLQSCGCTVYEFSRSGKDENGVHHCTVDMGDEKMVQDAVSFVLEKEGHIDLLLSNAGYGIAGAIEYTNSADSHSQMETNLWGMDYAVKAVLPSMRKAGKGRIVCISSVAGAIPIPFQAWYSISKAAINAYCLALQNEVKPYGISVCAILPGDMHTGFTAAREKNFLGSESYGGRIEKSVAGMEKDERNGMSSEEAGEKIGRIALKEKSKIFYVLGGKYKALHLLYRCLPVNIANWLVGKVYG